MVLAETLPESNSPKQWGIAALLHLVRSLSSRLTLAWNKKPFFLVEQGKFVEEKDRRNDRWLKALESFHINPQGLKIGDRIFFELKSGETFETEIDESWFRVIIKKANDGTVEDMTSDWTYVPRITDFCWDNYLLISFKEKAGHHSYWRWTNSKLKNIRQSTIADPVQ
jgi:hypothetical protein